MRLEEIEAQIAAVERSLASLTNNAVEDIFFRAKIGKCPPTELAVKWIAQTALKVSGRVFVLPHRSEHAIVLISALGYANDLPKDYVLVKVPTPHSGDSTEWSHPKINALYRQWLSNG
jgi:hypothetical protein